MASVTDTQVFNRTDRFVEGWYWAVASREVRAGQVRALNLLGRELVIWRDQGGRVHAHDAYCPHMGAHLAEGTVDGDTLRCFFHHWRYDADGALVEIPCQDALPKARIATWPCAEQYGMIWVWAGGAEPRLPVPYIPEVEGVELRWRHGSRFVKGCHPNVVMINAIDEQHFHSVHPLASSLASGGRFEVTERDPSCIVFDNVEPVPDTNAVTRFLGRFYDDALTYRMVYWNGTTGSVTVGPDLLHFHIIFALRPTADGHCEGQTILVTPRVAGKRGWLFNHASLVATEIVGNYFADGDTRVFQTMKWDFRTPIKADRPVIRFIQHLERQRTSAWGTWEPVDRPAHLRAVEA